MASPDFPEARTFGYKTADLEEAPVPAGERCHRCDEVIVAGDDGIITPFLADLRGTTLDVGGPSGIAAFHRSCFMRGLVGSVGHQMDLCSCRGGTMEDPPGFTRRQAALLATALAAFNVAHAARPPRT
jgi:hypothetical protein